MSLDSVDSCGCHGDGKSEWILYQSINREFLTVMVSERKVGVRDVAEISGVSNWKDRSSVTEMGGPQ